MSTQQPTEADRVAALQAEAADAYTARATREAAARDQLAHTRAHAQEAAGTR